MRTEAINVESSATDLLLSANYLKGQLSEKSAMTDSLNSLNVTKKRQIWIKVRLNSYSLKSKRQKKPKTNSVIEANNSNFHFLALTEIYFHMKCNINDIELSNHLI